MWRQAATERLKYDRRRSDRTAEPPDARARGSAWPAGARQELLVLFLWAQLRHPSPARSHTRAYRPTRASSPEKRNARRILHHPAHPHTPRNSGIQTRPSPSPAQITRHATRHLKSETRAGSCTTPHTPPPPATQASKPREAPHPSEQPVAHPVTRKTNRTQDPAPRRTPHPRAQLRYTDPAKPYARANCPSRASLPEKRTARRIRPNAAHPNLARNSGIQAPRGPTPA
ncbi:hypothetical protein EDF39_1435 [Frondihabitans sp. PhB161]|nr:hypothetical protein EDF37_1433 [Frondihabitans sp. PhB153]RPF09033.1 hypothetical protein EDF39_1435 [Frondihabitans sp. PhB161]